MNLHLFSNPGEDLQDVIEASHPYLEGKDNPIIMLCDDAYVKVEGRKTSLVRGGAWILRKGSEKIKLEVGGSIVP